MYFSIQSKKTTHSWTRNKAAIMTAILHGALFSTFRLESGGCRDYAAAFARSCGSRQNERPRLPLSVSRSWEGHEHRSCMEMGGSVSA
jgi:hypothetical protein